MEQPSEDRNLDYQRGTAGAADLHDAAKREVKILPAGSGNVSLPLLIVSSLVLIVGGGHLFSTSNGFRDSIYADKYYHPDPRPVVAGAADAGAKVAWIDEWMDEGKKVYGNCIACHQANGSGLPGAFPPLAGSEWVSGGTKRLGAILMAGINGPFHVEGQAFNQLMPAWNSLGDEKMAQVLTYVRRTFVQLPEGEDGVVTTEMMKSARDEFGAHVAPFTEAELLAIPMDAHLSGAKVNLETGDPL